MLRPPPGAERLSEIEALKRKNFLIQFLIEPTETESLGTAPPTSYSATGASAAQGTPSSSASAGSSFVISADVVEPESKEY